MNKLTTLNFGDFQVTIIASHFWISAFHQTFLESYRDRVFEAPLAKRWITSHDASYGHKTSRRIFIKFIWEHFKVVLYVKIDVTTATDFYSHFLTFFKMNISSWKRIYKFVFLLIELLYYTSFSMILLKLL